MLFPPNKTIRGRLEGRVTYRRRGKRFVVWTPWTIEPVQDLVAHHSLDLDDYLTQLLIEETNSQ